MLLTGKEKKSEQSLWSTLESCKLVLSFWKQHHNEPLTLRSVVKNESVIFLLMRPRFSNLDNTLIVFMLCKLCENKQGFAWAVQLLKSSLGEDQVSWLYQPLQNVMTALALQRFDRGRLPWASLHSLAACFQKSCGVLISLNLNLVDSRFLVEEGQTG